MRWTPSILAVIFCSFFFISVPTHSLLRWWTLRWQSIVPHKYCIIRMDKFSRFDIARMRSNHIIKTSCIHCNSIYNAYTSAHYTYIIYVQILGDHRVATVAVWLVMREREMRTVRKKGQSIFMQHKHVILLLHASYNNNDIVFVKIAVVRKKISTEAENINALYVCVCVVINECDAR